ncbi:hypothetical protein ACWD4N_21840 [Streptomyces sp. NPDC002586]
MTSKVKDEQLTAQKSSGKPKGQEGVRSGNWLFSLGADLNKVRITNLGPSIKKGQTSIEIQFQGHKQTAQQDKVGRGFDTNVPVDFDAPALPANLTLGQEYTLEAGVWDVDHGADINNGDPATAWGSALLTFKVK